MVSGPETIPSRLLVTSSNHSEEELRTRLAALEETVEQLQEENERLRDENKRLRAKLRWHEGPHTPPSKDQSDHQESSSSGGDEDDDQPRTDGGTPGRKSGHDCCPDCGEQFDESAGVSPRLIEDLPDQQPPEVTQYNRHHYECDSCGTETVASHPDCPDEGVLSGKDFVGHSLVLTSVFSGS